VLTVSSVDHDYLSLDHDYLPFPLFVFLPANVLCLISLFFFRFIMRKKDKERSSNPLYVS